MRLGCRFHAYRFPPVRARLTARDSAIQGGSAEDTFRIKIWETTTGNIVYDNGSNQPIGGGSIVIHK